MFHFLFLLFYSSGLCPLYERHSFGISCFVHSLDSCSGHGIQRERERSYSCIHDNNNKTKWCKTRDSQSPRLCARHSSQCWIQDQTDWLRECLLLFIQQMILILFDSINARSVLSTLLFLSLFSICLGYLLLFPCQSICCCHLRLSVAFRGMKSWLCFPLFCLFFPTYTLIPT